MAAVEVAENLPEIARSPERKTNPLKVEEAVANSPPAGVREKTVVEEMFWTIKGAPVCPPSMRNVRRLEVVEVAATVRTELTSAVVVPIEKLSVLAVE